MFLLKLLISNSVRGAADFTFHNVSIKTDPVHVDEKDFPPFTFHNVSIKTKVRRLTKSVLSSFTFHNVSIKTSDAPQRAEYSMIFTFHNVSIKTPLRSLWKHQPSCFTFHNVSIKTQAAQQPGAPQTPLHSTMFLLKRGIVQKSYRDWQLYIPQCFY